VRGFVCGLIIEFLPTHSDSNIVQHCKSQTIVVPGVLDVAGTYGCCWNLRIGCFTVQATCRLQ